MNISEKLSEILRKEAELLEYAIKESLFAGLAQLDELTVVYPHNGVTTEVWSLNKKLEVGDRPIDYGHRLFSITRSYGSTGYAVTFKLTWG